MLAIIGAVAVGAFVAHVIHMHMRPPQVVVIKEPPLPAETK